MKKQKRDDLARGKVTRRSAMQTLGLGLAALPLVKLAACSSDGNGTAGDADAGVSNADAAAVGCDNVPGAWASGGTAAMTAKDCYPDPFAAGVASCALLCETTQGPCTSTTLERQDVSEGFLGLPVRLALKIVTADACTPVVDAKVEIWHTQRTGVYSGVTPAGQFCYGNDPGAVDHLYFRGSQTTDASGVIAFDTCFPGWYSGRALHIHFRVYLNDQLYITSQLFFADALASEIFSSHPDYAEFGQPNTTNSSDNIIGGTADKTPYLLDTQRMPDGAMLASKIVAIRASTSDASCTA